MSYSFSGAGFTRLSCGAILLASTINFANAQQATLPLLEEFWTLPGGGERGTDAIAVSATGKKIAGWEYRPGEVFAIYWPSATADPVRIGTLPGGAIHTYVQSMNADGTVIIGAVTKASGAVEGFRWKNGSMEGLGLLQDGTYSIGLDVDASGDIVVGYGSTTGGLDRAFRWQDGQIEDLGGPQVGTHSYAAGISSDGKVIVGSFDKLSGLRGAARWANNQVQELPPLPGHTNAVALGVNGDGSVIVGSSVSGGVTAAIRWQEGIPEDLGLLVPGEDTMATKVSDDGSIVVGQSSTPAGLRSSFRWENGHMEDIGGLTGAVETIVTDISADGSTIVGSSYMGTTSRSFVYRTAIQDLANVQASAVEVANEFADTVDLNGRMTRTLREEDCHIAEMSRACIGLRAGATSLFQGTNALGGSVTGAVNLSETLKVGGSVAAYGEGHAGTTLDLHYGVGVGGFAEYLIGPLAVSPGETHVRARLDGAWFVSDADVTRGQNYNDVQVGRGSTQFSSGSVGVRLFADHQFSENVVLSPYIGAFWENTSQSGYQEQTELDTVARINGGSVNAVAGLLGLHTRFRLWDKLDVGFGLRGEVDFFSEDVEVSAKINIPGLTSFSVGTDQPKNRVRVTAEASAAYNVTDQSRVEVLGQLFSSRYQDKLGGDLALRFSSSF